MKGIKLVDLSLFEKTNYRYNLNVSPKCRYHSNRGEKYGRIFYYLPNGLSQYFYQISKDVKGNNKLLSLFIREFEIVIRQGYFPRNVAQKTLMRKQIGVSNKVTILEAIGEYYGQYNFGKNQKSFRTVLNERPTLTKIGAYFINKGKRHLFEIADSDLENFSGDVESWESHISNKKLRPSTISSYKKLLKAFLFRMKKIYKLELDPTILDTNIYVKGKIDKSAGSRTIHIPSDLLDMVDNCTYQSRPSTPDIKELIHLLRVTGLCKMELSTLSYHNLLPSPLNFDRLILKDKPECPCSDGLGFTIKTINRNREIPLDNRSIKFIKYQMEKHRNDVIYGKVTSYDENGNQSEKYIEYPFLFPQLREGRWQRCNDFIRSIQAVLRKTSKQFNIGCEQDRYTVHDFRTTRNGELGDMGISREHRAYLLGHDEKVNESNYYDAKRIRDSKRDNAFSVLQNAKNRK